MGTERRIDFASRGVHVQFVWKEQEGRQFVTLKYSKCL